MKLSKERDSLAMTTKKLGRDLSKVIISLLTLIVKINLLLHNWELFLAFLGYGKLGSQYSFANYEEYLHSREQISY